MFKTTLTLLMLGCFLSSSGQTEVTKGLQKDGLYRIAYNGHNGFHPGFHVSREYTWKYKLKVKTKKNGKVKSLDKTNFFLPQLNYYNHVRKENNFTLGSEVIRRRHKDNKTNRTHEWGVGLFYMRSFNTGTTYKVVEGEVKKVALAGQNYLAPSLSYAFSRSFLNKSSNPIIAYIKPMIYLMLPYNDAMVPNVNLQLGIRKSLNFGGHE
jgi:hypothetical protein